MYLTHLLPNYPDCCHLVSSTWALLPHLLPYVYKLCFHSTCPCVCVAFSLIFCLCLAGGSVIYSRCLGFKCFQCFQFWSATWLDSSLCLPLECAEQTELCRLRLHIMKRKSHHHGWWPLLYFYNPSMGLNNQGHTHATWHLTTLRPKTTLLIAELIKTFVCGHWQDNKTAIILVRKSLSVPLYQRLIPSLWRGSHISSHTGSNFHCSSFLSQSPPHSPVVETINSATFHKAVWWGYHLNSLPRPFLSSFAPTAALNEWLNVERRP